MTLVLIRSVDIEQQLRRAYDQEPSCRVIERGGVAYAVFRDRSIQSAAVINISELARQLGAKLS